MDILGTALIAAPAVAGACGLSALFNKKVGAVSRAVGGVTAGVSALGLMMTAGILSDSDPEAGIMLIFLLPALNMVTLPGGAYSLGASLQARRHAKQAPEAAPK